MNRRVDWVRAFIREGGHRLEAARMTLVYMHLGVKGRNVKRLFKKLLKIRYASQRYVLKNLAHVLTGFSVRALRRTGCTSIGVAAGRGAFSRCSALDLAPFLNI